MNGYVPLVEGFRVERDPLTDEWIATSASGNYKIRGWTQQDLIDARWRLWRRLLADFRLAIAEVYPSRSSLQTPRGPARPLPRRIPGRNPAVRGGNGPARASTVSPSRRAPPPGGAARRQTLALPGGHPRSPCRTSPSLTWRSEMRVLPAKAPSGWTRAGNIGRVPLWKREPCYVATRDMDHLRFIGSALVRFEVMSASEFHAFIQHEPT
jgi:hypothetical protein